jgi:predicted MPP superfamily phosphohydrolase
MLPPGSARLRLAFVSDLHLGPTTPPRLLDAAFEQLRAAKPDVLLLGGDYVFLEATRPKADELARRVASVPARTKLAVLGNHDLWARHELLESALESAGVHVLVNESRWLDGAGLCVVGLDDPWTGTLDVPAAFASAGDAEAVVVLCHSPDAAPAVQELLQMSAKTRSVLYTCGHTHGGHIATPWGPLVVPGRLGKRHPAGLYALDGLNLHVSRGIGGIEVPVRAFAPPEIAIFDLLARAA